LAAYKFVLVLFPSLKREGMLFLLHFTEKPSNLNNEKLKDEKLTNTRNFVRRGEFSNEMVFTWMHFQL